MVSFLNEAVLEKIDEIIRYIENTEDYIKHSEISAKMKEDKEIISIINRIKDLQKAIVREMHIGNKVDHLEKEISINLDKLNSYPIYKEFTYLQEDLNNTFQDVKNVIEKYVNERVN